jgi:hypothetical protein
MTPSEISRRLSLLEGTAVARRSERDLAAERAVTEMARLGIDLGKLSTAELRRLEVLAMTWPDDASASLAAQNRKRSGEVDHRPRGAGGVTDAYCRLLSLTCFATDIVEAILDGRSRRS